MMENASIDAKEHLVTLTSIDGDWFLEEMLSLIVNCNHLTQLIRKAFTKNNRLMNTESTFYKSFDIFNSLPLVFGNLKDMIFNYETDLLPRLIQMSMNEADEVEEILEEFKSIDFDSFFQFITKENFLIENFETVKALQ